MAGPSVRGAIILDERSGVPATPPAGRVALYAKTDGLLYRLDDAGAELRLDASVENTPFSQTGVLTVKAGTSRYPVKGGTFQILSVAAMVNTAPTGAAILVDVNKNGTTIFTTQGNRPSIAFSGFSATVGAFAATTVTDGDYLTVDIDQVGSTIAGSDLTVVIRMQRIA